MKKTLADKKISKKQIEFYNENGFLVVSDALRADEIKKLNQETLRVCNGELGAIRGGIPGNLGDTEEQVFARYLCIHFPHKISRVMFDTLAHPVIVKGLKALIGPDVKCMQSMLFIKAASKPGQAWHQDEFYIPTRDRSLTAAWIAQDDATLENGCLWVIPGSHKHGIIWPQHEQNDPRFDCSGESYNFPYRDEDAIPVVVKAGTVVFFNGYLLHRSLPNNAKKGFRKALVNHYMSASSLLPWHWPPKQSGMGELDYRDIVMVSGKDPYAWKGIEEIAEPHVRPYKEGGCGNAENNIEKTS